MQKLRNNVLLSVGLILCGLAYFAWVIFQNKTILFRRFDSVSAEKIYSQSQWQQSQNISPDKVLDEWAIKNKYTGWKNFVDENEKKLDTETVKKTILTDIQKKGVSDSFLYSYVGYKYAKGANPSLLNPEHPPLAKYLIGMSILLFGSEHVVGIGIAALTLVLVAIISYQIYGSLFFAGLSLFLTSVFPLFTDQITHGPQLEIYQLFFFLILTLFFLLLRKEKKMVFAFGAGISFGMLLSIKTLAPFLVLFGVWILVLFWKQWKELFIIFVVGAVTFCLTYFSYFLHGGTLRTFLGLQKYIIVYYGNANIPLLEFVGNYLRLIYTGSWKFWDLKRTVGYYSEWNLLWPIIFSLGIWTIIQVWRTNKKYFVLILFIVLYNIFLFIIPVFPRYLLLLFVPLIILI